MSIATQEAPGLQLEQAVEVNRGPLAGISGVLACIRGDHCLIKLDVKPQGVLLLINAAAVKALPRTPPFVHRTVGYGRKT